MGKRKIKWLPGDSFLVPLEDGTYGQGQIVCHELHALDSVLCAFSSIRHKSVPGHLGAITEENLIAILFVTRDLLDSGRWRVVNSGPVILPWEKYIDLRQMRNRGFVGVKIIGSFIVANFLSAYHQLVPWDDFHDPEYLDKLLISRDLKPANVLLK
jgi:hypothetical protein